MKYRLLDVGEDYRDGDEILTVSNGWQRISGYGTVQAHTVPMRRPDDGKGKYLVACGFDMMVADFSGTEFWEWGVGWVRWTPEITDRYSETIWRKAREVEKPKEQESNWVVFGEDDDIKGFFKSEKDALDHLQSEEMMIDERYHIAKIVKTVVVKMIVTEVAS